MNGKLRYSGIAAITFTLFMLSLGSMPTSEAQSVTSTLNVDVSCGITLLNPTINWDGTVVPGAQLDSTNGADFSGTEPTLENNVANKTSDTI